MIPDTQILTGVGIVLVVVGVLPILLGRTFIASIDAFGDGEDDADRTLQGRETINDHYWGLARIFYALGRRTGKREANRHARKAALNAQRQKQARR